MASMIKSCPNCGSTNVEEFLAGFFKANEPSLDKGTDGDVQLAEMYSDLYWCPDCETHPNHLEEIPDGPGTGGPNDWGTIGEPS